jgi:hypothetical protein
MTVLNGIEIDKITYTFNPTKQAIANNSPLDDKLHVIVVISNPCQYAKRIVLMKQFVERMEQEENVELYIVEMAYWDQPYYVTNEKCKKHLQVRTETPLWHKENMVNIGVKYLLPSSWKAFAWIDADIEFESSTWALDTLKILNGYKDIVQLFSHCCDMDEYEASMRVFNSAGYQWERRGKYENNGANFSHPGFAWAMTRTAYERVGGLYENAILGSGDNIMLFSLLNNGLKAININSTEDYKEDILNFERKMKSLRFGYTPGVIRHYYHGSKANRKYTERWTILLKHEYAPSIHITQDSLGILIPTSDFPEELKKDIFRYFSERKEDE